MAARSFMLLAFVFKLISAQHLPFQPIITETIIESSQTKCPCKELSSAIQNAVLTRFTSSAAKQPLFGQIVGPLLQDIASAINTCPYLSAIQITPEGYTRSSVPQQVITDIIGTPCACGCKLVEANGQLQVIPPCSCGANPCTCRSNGTCTCNQAPCTCGSTPCRCGSVACSCGSIPCKCGQSTQVCNCGSNPCQCGQSTQVCNCGSNPCQCGQSTQVCNCGSTPCICGSNQSCNCNSRPCVCTTNANGVTTCTCGSSACNCGSVQSCKCGLRPCTCGSSLQSCNCGTAPCTCGANVQSCNCGSTPCTCGSSFLSCNCGSLPCTCIRPTPRTIEIVVTKAPTCPAQSAKERFFYNIFKQ